MDLLNINDASYIRCNIRLLLDMVEFEGLLTSDNIPDDHDCHNLCNLSLGKEGKINDYINSTSIINEWGT